MANSSLTEVLKQYPNPVEMLRNSKIGMAGALGDFERDIVGGDEAAEISLQIAGFQSEGHSLPPACFA